MERIIMISDAGRSFLFRFFYQNTTSICLLFLLMGAFRFVELSGLSYGEDFCLVFAPLAVVFIICVQEKITSFDMGDFLIVLIYVWFNLTMLINKTSLGSTLGVHVLFILYCILRKRNSNITESLIAKCLGVITTLVLLHFLIVKLFYSGQVDGVQSLLGNNVFLAIYLAIGLPFIYRLFKSKYLAISITVLLLGLIGYYSRTALIAICISAIMYKLFLYPNRKQAILLVGVTFILVLSLASLNIASIHGRFLIWKITLQSIDWYALVIGKGPNYIYNHFLICKQITLGTIDP